MINDRNQREQDDSGAGQLREQHTRQGLTRRQFLRAGLGATTALALPALASCQTEPPTPTLTPASAAATTAPSALAQSSTAVAGPTAAGTTVPTTAATAAATAGPTITGASTPTPGLGASQPNVIVSTNGFLHTSLRVSMGPDPRNLTPPTNFTLRAYESQVGESEVWARSIPGPTLRLKKGDVFQLDMINNLDPLPPEHACAPPTDLTPTSSPTSTPAPVSTPTSTPAPAPIHDIYPECFHNLNTTNIHFHGSHTFPELPGDDVLYSIPPKGQQTYRFSIHQNQAPGTHWYHPHNHGSTAIQVLNGMAGAFIIEGDFDNVPEIAQAKDLVFILQQIGEHLNFLTPNNRGAGNPPVIINGVQNPTVTMYPGEVQRWRFIGATMQASGIVELSFQTSNGAEQPEMYQIAADGVQFSNDQWDPDTPTSWLNIAPGNRADVLVKAPNTPGQYMLVPRLPAPRVTPTPQSSSTPTPAATPTPTNLMTIEVVSPPPNSGSYPTTLPAKGSLPQLPSFLQPITNEELTDSQGQERKRSVVFSIVGSQGQQPAVFIDCKQFDPSNPDHSMVVNTAEEWTIYNFSPLMHPFHIHINPFMVTAIHDPNQATQREVDSTPMRWQDTIPLPPAGKTQQGALDPGYVTIRHRFIDFTGQYVIHCHILGHEDRGMMQLVQTVEAEDACPPGTRWQDKQQIPTCAGRGVPENVIHTGDQP